MANGYKKALARFEAAVRDDAFKGTLLAAAEDDPDAAQAYADIEKEYKDSKAALIRKLQYRQLAAEMRAEEARRDYIGLT